MVANWYNNYIIINKKIDSNKLYTICWRLGYTDFYVVNTYLYSYILGMYIFIHNIIIIAVFLLFIHSCIYIIFNINTLNIDILFMFCYMFIVDSRDTQILCIHTHIDHIDHIVIKYNYRLLDMSK